MAKAVKAAVRKVPKPCPGGYTVTKPTAVVLRMVKPWIVDRVVRWARRMDYCEVVEEGLTMLFGDQPKGWRDSDGYDLNGRDPEGYTKDGYDDDGFDRDGYDGLGYNKEGWNAAGFNRYGWPSYVDGVVDLVEHLSPWLKGELLKQLQADADGRAQPPADDVPTILKQRRPGAVAL